MKKTALYIALFHIVACGQPKDVESKVIYSDIDLFWNAFDQILLVEDSLDQLRLLDSLYLEKGSPGLHKILEVKNYYAADYIKLIRNHPEFWKSIRKNTLRTKRISKELNKGIENLRTVYPKLKPAKIYFTMGAMRTNGTTQDSSVLIGSELAMADSSIDISEFNGRTKQWLKNYFATNPIENIVLLNIHEYVHTQQKEMPGNLLHIVLYEGIAEFVSVKAMGVPSSTPAVEFGFGNSAVKRKFQKEMFYERTYDWLWSSAPNEFEIRDLGYYIGYALAEIHYEKSKDKKKAIQELIELDYKNKETVDSLIDACNFFSKPIQELRIEDEKARPKIKSINSIGENFNEVNPNTTEISFEFSEPLNGLHTGVNYGEMGDKAFPKILEANWSEDKRIWTLMVELKENHSYQFYITENFRNEEGLPLMPYLLEFKTISK